MRLTVLGIFLAVGFDTSFAGADRWASFGPTSRSVVVSELAIDRQNPTTLYAVKEGALFKSTDGGANWRALNHGSGWVSSFVVDPQDSRNVYAGGWSQVFKSDDGGDSWTATNIAGSWLDFGASILAIDPKNPSTIYAGTVDEDWGSGGVLKSTDGGITWRRTPLKVTDWGAIYVYSLVIDPQQPEVLYVGTGGALYQSMDGGATWRSISIGFRYTVDSVAVDPANSNTLYLGTTGGVFKSEDRGMSWSSTPLLSNASYIARVQVDPHDSQTVYATTDRGSFKSTDGGGSWGAMSLLLPDVFPLAWDPKNPNTIYSRGSNGLFKTTDGGMTWRPLYSGLALGTDAVVADPQNPGFVYAFTYEGAVFKSTDGARRWNSISWNFPGTGRYSAVAINPQDSRIIYAVRNETLYKTIDGGSNWSTANIGLRTSFPAKLVIDPQNPNTVYTAFRVESSAAYFSSELFKSTNGGSSWNSVGLVLPSITAFAVNPQNPNNLYVGTYGRLLRSTDGGSTWTDLQTIGRIGGITDLAFDSRNADIVHAAGCAFYKSTDAGTSWTRSYVGGCISELLVDPQNPDTLYARSDNALFKTTNGGVSWNAESSITEGYRVEDLAIESNTGRPYVATSGGGVFSIFDASQTTRVPSLALDSTEYCSGKPWSLSISGARPDSTIDLSGNSNGQAWELNLWRKTDGNGGHEEKGTFVKGTEGRHMLYVDVDGASSNDVSFRIRDC
jgi:photosystem II stability/assembly factor-like uncharacterized protein